MAEVQPCYVLHNAGSVHTGETDRMHLSALIAGARIATSLIGRGGVNPIHGGGLKVTAQGTPSLILDIASGVAFVPGTEGSKQGIYCCVNDATDTVTMDTAHGTLPRIDLVVATVRDSVYSGALNDWLIQKVTGTAAGSPVPPATPANSIILATVNRSAADDTIANTDIVDSRAFIAAAGGVIACTSTTRPGITTVAAGQPIWETDTSRFAISNGAAYIDPAMISNFSTTNVQIFTSGGSWTKPTNAKRVRVQCQGGGGAGGGAQATGAGEGAVGVGGQGGAYGESWFDASALGSSVTVTIGAGGTGVSGGTGNAGGTTSFGSHVVADGGAGGTILIAAATITTQSGAGTAAQTITANLAIPGGGGGLSLRNVSSSFGGMGGSSALGNGGPGAGSNGAGHAGKNYGGGGSGASNQASQSARTGGAGAGGVCVVTTFI
jgi:hypothetical protein